MSSAPLIADVTVDGRARKVVAVPSKQAWLWVFDRVTGEPIWPIEEKPVPKGDVPGEWYSPTQPHPPAALMYGRNAVTISRRSDRLHAGAARAGGEADRSATATSTTSSTRRRWSANVNGLLGAITMGAANGGTNWPGGGYDPETHTVVRDGGDRDDRRRVGRAAAAGILRSRLPGGRRRAGVPRAARGGHRHVRRRAAAARPRRPGARRHQATRRPRPRRRRRAAAGRQLPRRLRRRPERAAAAAAAAVAGRAPDSPSRGCRS